MKYDEFIAAVERRADLRTHEEAERATRATLRALAECLAGDEPENLAAQLPPEIAQYLRGVDTTTAYSVDDFVQRVSALEGAEFSIAMQHARAVLDIVRTTVTTGEFEDVRAQLPTEFDRLLE